ncbi:hypothetical protein LPW33_03485 [Ectothiorhodospira variabilis]|nr:hypothetical protein [Ectothiorhodospira variabilis]MCG5503116.1 hypothetical protein [Ectothiorhodospira variabilis]MCG5506125.1 hypothetical protein [Ectothiorhodospira variabilis]
MRADIGELISLGRGDDIAGLVATDDEADLSGRYVAEVSTANTGITVSFATTGVSRQISGADMLLFALDGDGDQITDLSDDVSSIHGWGCEWLDSGDVEPSDNLLPGGCR